MPQVDAGDLKLDSPPPHEDSIWITILPTLLMIGSEDKVRQVVDKCKEKNIPIRIGVNAGSLEKELLEKYGKPTAKAMVESAKRHIDILENMNFKNYAVSYTKQLVRYR